jgi:hypothetical protein
MFSFGLIKIQTAYFGAVSVFRDLDLYERTFQIQETYPLFTRQLFMKKITQVLWVYYYINTNPGNRLLLLAARISGLEREEFFIQLSR